MEQVEAVKEFKEWVITKAALAAKLHQEFSGDAQVYAEGSLGAYHDVRVELDKLILIMEEDN